MSPSTTLKLIGILMTIVAVGALLGWYFLDWKFVDPFLNTLVLVASPFFIGMGMARPSEQRTRIRASI